jgi:CBS domain containing-hemolysin-like protein
MRREDMTIGPEGLKTVRRLLAVTVSTSVNLVFVSSALAAGAVSSGDVSGEGTSGDMALLVFYILIALGVSFACSIAEAVLLSITPSYIEGMRDTQPKRASLLKRLRQDNVDRSLAAILTLNTIAHTAGAIGAGAQATRVFGSAWTGAFSAVMTLAILFLSEIVPKTIGTVYWRTLVDPTAVFIRVLTVILYPLVWVSEWITRLIARGRDVHVFSRQEFIAMADVCEESGHIDVHESRIFRNLFKLESLRARDVMTPRTVVMAFPESLTVTDMLSGGQPIRHSRLPVFRGDIDHVTGFVLKDDILMAEAQGSGDRPLVSLKRRIVAVSAAMPLPALLEFLLRERHHIALVVDEYGGTSGLVTLEDILETLLGAEIVDESDSVEDLQLLARRLGEERSVSPGLDTPADEADGTS